MSRDHFCSSLSCSPQLFKNTQMQMIGLSSGRLWISLGSRQSMLHNFYWSYREDKNPTYRGFKKKRSQTRLVSFFKTSKKKNVATTACAFVCKQGRLPLEGPSLVTVPRSPLFNFNNHLVLDLEGTSGVVRGSFSVIMDLVVV